MRRPKDGPTIIHRGMRKRLQKTRIQERESGVRIVDNGRLKKFVTQFVEGITKITAAGILRGVWIIQKGELQNDERK